MASPKILIKKGEKFFLRSGHIDDVPAVHKLVHELAAFERAEHEFVVTVAQMKEYGFGHNPLYEMIVVENERKEIIGMAIYYVGYSTWKGPFFYLEDLIVTEKYRRYGLGAELLDSLILEAKDKKAVRMGWQVLDWNESAIAFYKSIGAALQPEWINCRLSGQQIEAYEAGDLLAK